MHISTIRGIPRPGVDYGYQSEQYSLVLSMCTILDVSIIVNTVEHTMYTSVYV